jgi:hypothetical protein
MAMVTNADKRRGRYAIVEEYTKVREIENKRERGKEKMVIISVDGLLSEVINTRKDQICPGQYKIW